MKVHKLFNFKSHDCHILMQDLLPIALRAIKDDNFVDLVCELSDFLRDYVRKS